MPLTEYCVFPPGWTVPPGFAARSAAAGFHADASGNLLQPPLSGTWDMLVFDDRNPIPMDNAEALVESLAEAALKLGASALFLDLERPPTPGSRAFLELLSQTNLQLLVPEAYAFCNEAAIVSTWMPKKGSFSAYLQVCSSAGYLELSPVCLRLEIDAHGAKESRASSKDLQTWLDTHTPAVYTDETLLCRYASVQQADRLVVHLWDTPDTLQRKRDLICQCGLRGLLTLYPELAAVMTMRKTDGTL